MKLISTASSLLVLAAAANLCAQPLAENTIDEVVITADFRQTQLQNLATSATVIESDTIRYRHAEHLERLLNTAPNVNFSAGASRGRFIQIRGIGERSQFVEPINPSVGLIVDGIDLTGIGGAATTLDISQVEVLRGPQGTLHGANAMAGLINMVSTAPTDTHSGKLGATLGDYNSRTITGAISGPLSDQLGFRLAAEQHSSDGYQKNAFLNSEDNARYDEQTLRGSVRWQPADTVKLDFHGLYVDVDNGYDGFSLDNTRTTLSDQPGHDRQQTSAASARVNWQLHNSFSLVGLVSHADSTLEYGYDEDWAFTDICVVFTCIYDGYNSFDNYLRDNQNTTLDIKLVSTNTPAQMGWVVGAYYRDQNEDLQREYTYLDNDFFSNFTTQNSALYGQLDFPLNSTTTLVTGLRYEQRDADYSDSDTVSFTPTEDMWGGKLALEYRPEDNTLAYALISRGYKAGGFNSNTNLAANEREFSSEALLNYEIGLKAQSTDGRLQAQLALFYQDREDIQTKQSLLQAIEGDNCPCHFIDYTTNAASGDGYGLEAEINWQINSFIDVFTSIGLLQSQFKDFASFAHSEADTDSGTPYDLSGHNLPHAPRYQYAVGALLHFTDNWYARIEVEGKDSFYFSSRHEAQADAYKLLNARLGYNTEHWELALWGRNLSDEDVQVRGFGSFGNDPRNGYEAEPYYQYGEPRMIGASAQYRF